MSPVRTRVGGSGRFARQRHRLTSGEVQGSSSTTGLAEARRHAPHEIRPWREPT